MTYTPGKDSFLLKNWLERQRLENLRVLDMGTGSGILAVEAAKNGAEVVAADIDSEALEKAEARAEEEDVGHRINFVSSDLFENVNGGFDLIVFNPPYLPGEEIDDEDPTWRGGEKGIELTESFLEQAPDHLKEDGETVFVASSRAGLEGLRERFELELLDSEKLWFETLYLLKRG